MITFSYELSLMMTFVVAFVITYLSIPSIVSLAYQKKIFDAPSQRKSHLRQTPTLGGIAIFAGLCISVGLFVNSNYFTSLQYILVACIIMFYIGVKDDIQSLAPHLKFMGQIIAALILIIPGNIYFSSLHGFLGIYNISIISSLFITLFVIILIINSLNLIDGIDGLAASLGMLITVFFGVWFYISGNMEYSLISAALFGSLLGFFRFNIYNGHFKIFMGDTGSLIVGLIIAIQVILFNEKNIGYTSAIPIKYAPAVTFALLIVPLYDTIRVSIIRVYRGRSPFAADKNHLHHLLLKLGFSHIRTMFTILFINIGFLFMALLLQYIFPKNNYLNESPGICIFLIALMTICAAALLTSFLEHKVRRNGTK